MDTTLLTGLIAGLGIGSIFTALIQWFLKREESAYESQRQDLEKRYHVIILLMYAALDFESNKTTMRIHRPDLKNRKDILDELKAEWYNMFLFASGATLENLHSFITDPDEKNFRNAAFSMRKDLNRNKFSSKIEKLFFKS